MQCAELYTLSSSLARLYKFVSKRFFFQKLGRSARTQGTVRSLMLQIVRITVTKAEGSGFGLGLQDYNGGTRIHIVAPGAAGAAVSPDTKAHICTSILDDRDQTYFFA